MYSSMKRSTVFYTVLTYNQQYVTIHCSATRNLESWNVNHISQQPTIAWIWNLGSCGCDPIIIGKSHHSIMRFSYSLNNITQACNSVIIQLSCSLNHKTQLILNHTTQFPIPTQIIRLNHKTQLLLNHTNQLFTQSHNSVYSNSILQLSNLQDHASEILNHCCSIIKLSCALYHTTL